MGLIGAASTAAANALAHTITFGLNLAIFSNMCQFIYHSIKVSPARSHFSNWAPFYLMVLATILVMIDLVRHVLQDSRTFLLTTPTGNSLGIRTDVCSYRIPQITGKDCPESGVGPVTISEISAVNMQGWSMYNPDGSLSTVGWFVTVGCTWSGMIMMTVAITLSMTRKRSSSETQPLL